MMAEIKNSEEGLREYPLPQNKEVKNIRIFREKFRKLNICILRIPKRDNSKKMEIKNEINSLKSFPKLKYVIFQNGPHCA